MTTIPRPQIGEVTRESGAALARCVSVPPAEFGRSYWGRRPLVSPADRLPGSFADLLTLDDVDELLSVRGLRTPFIRLAKNGAVLGSGQFTGGGGVGAEIDDQVVDDAVGGLFADGATVVLQGLHRMWPSIIRFAGQLGTDLGHPVQVNAYITPPSSQGFSAHYDVHDVFVLQLAGSKQWMVHEPVHIDPLRDQPWDQRANEVATAARQRPLIDRVLSPGDALYLPRGYLHSARALGEVSAHLTVGVHVVTRYALVEALLSLVANDPALRSSLPLGFDPEHLGAEADTIVRTLVDAVSRVDPARAARLLRDRVWAGNRPAPLGPLRQAAAVHAVANGSLVRLRDGMRFDLRRRGDRVFLDIPGDTISLPASTGEALVDLLAGGPCVVGTLPGLDVDDQVVLVRRLLKEGILVPMDQPGTSV